MPKKPAVSAEHAEPSVKISARGVARLQGRHPWVYRSDVTESNDVPPGSLVRVLDQRGKFLGTALYSSSSQIAIRMISHGSVADLPSLMAERIRAAVAYRRGVVANTDAYRIVFSEADFLPGLIVDRYHDVVSVQILTQAMDAGPVRDAIVQTLAEVLQPAGIVERVDARIRELEQLPPLQSRLLWGEKSSTVFSMNCEKTTGEETSGVRFHYDGLEGQKTGAFLDQRENYAAAARYAHGEALDAFCYQGGFALHFAVNSAVHSALHPATRCSSVTGVDSSRPALEMAEKNATLNGREMEWIEANAFDLLREYAAANRRYDTIVLDPPAFAKTKRDLEKALGGYKELNLRAMKMLRPGGILVTCSCSYHVGAADFFEVVADAARDAHKSFRVIENRGAAKDHPMLLNVPETSYLKCLILSVSN
jgi:23S rRNA (cytosine1962-C5)-methyltransferase